MFTLVERFGAYDENYKPYGIRIQSSSALWHKHARCGDDGYTVACTGNKYLLDTPRLGDFLARLDFKFGTLHDYAAISLFFGYDTESFCGKELRIEWKRKFSSLSFTMLEIDGERYSERSSQIIDNVDFAVADKEYLVEVALEGGHLSAEIAGYGKACFEAGTTCGYFGFSRPHFIGTVTFTYAEVTWDAELKSIGDPVQVDIPLVNGGTMPLTAEYRLFCADGKPYLTATLDGGPQYRTEESYSPYPCNRRGQYCVEKWFMNTPYVTYNEDKYVMKMGEFNTVDPGLAWKELLVPMMNFSKLPLSITVPVKKADAESFGFGYFDLEISGYSMQKGKNEFKFSPEGKYLGEISPEDSFELRSPADKIAVKIIPESVFDYPTVKKHFENNHYFAEEEEISFCIESNTKKGYISYAAELLDVFGDKLEELSVIDGRIAHAPMPVGVYRVLLSVFYGDTLLKTVNTVFEVFDITGERCAPIESGLPFQFSTPNEQQYLDRDAFDPWNNGKACNSEHFYACVAFTGHVAEYKRIWEVTKLFGRKWYVWLSDNRSMVDHDIERHLDIVKNADYIYYPSDYEWEVLRSDFFLESLWGRMPKTYALLEEFLDSKDGAWERIGLVRGGKVTRQVISNLYKYYKKEWYALANGRIKEGFAAQNEMLATINPQIKRSCYGPFNVYVSTMRSSKLSEAYGFETGDTLSDIIYTGFAQFEDYPMTCAYQTYRGAFGAGSTLVTSPRLKIYPEQYKSDRGGCIDGAVFFAYPPIGKIDHPLWFNTTHSREYAYNTAKKTVDGFAYWDTYGFMKRDFSEDENEAFVKDWKYILRHKPSRPQKSTVFVCEFNENDDGFDGDSTRWPAPYNVSEEGVGYLYESSRLAGLPSGIFAGWKELLTVSESDTDLLVLPSTEGIDDATNKKIRELYAKGVALIAVSRVDGLEDLFGVKHAPKRIKYSSICSDDEQECVYPYEEEARYESDGAECILSADDTPAVFTYKRTALLNISPCALGRVYFSKNVENARSSASPLLREVCKDLLASLSSPIAISNGCGITLFEDVHGDSILLAIDYSRHDQTELELARESLISLEKGRYKNAEMLDGKSMRRLFAPDGTLDAVAVTLRQHESAMIKLI